MRGGARVFYIKSIAPNHREWVDALIAQSWAGPYIVTKGKLHDAREHEGFVAVDSGEIVGCVLFCCDECAQCEITVLESLREGRGIGTALIRAVQEVARAKGCTRLYLITTNDNTPAIHYYQRTGFELAAVHLGALTQARKLKPQIPLTGYAGMPIKHEFEFEMQL